ncbi:MAG: hypothetical protein ACI83N_002090, partial [Hydrogenophaga sp.]
PSARIERLDQRQPGALCWLERSLHSTVVRWP